jgi:signal transduction histidine kinase
MSTPNPMPYDQLHPWERRWLPVVHIGPYVVLALMVTYTIYARTPRVVAELVLCGVAGAAMLWMFTAHPAWRVRPRVMAAFFTIIVAVTIALITLDPWFGFFTIIGYVYAFSVLRWPWTLLGIAAMGFAAGTAQTTGVSRTSAMGILVWAVVVIANAVPMGGLAWVNNLSDVHMVQREQQFDEITEAKRQLEATLAENAGLHRQLVIQAREAGVLDERQRMAREIHDTLAQGLTGIITQLQAAERAENDPQRWRRHLTAATKLARESLTEARRSVHELRPESLSSGRLDEALRSVVEQFTALHAVPVEIATAGTVRPIAPEVEVVLLRAAQEALANAAKHARPSRIVLTLSYLDNEVALDVCDDGVGFDPMAAPARDPATGGFGLVAMRQRVEGLSGALSVESRAGTGTTISARIPDLPAEVVGA